jgi:hypothetical protein
MADNKKEADKGAKPLPVKRPQLHLSGNLEPQYANVVRISHTPSEMVFDFGQLLPGSAKAPVRSRVVMTPLSAKLLQRALTENLGKFESMFGEIKIPQGKSLADNLFGPVQSPENPDEGKD